MRLKERDSQVELEHDAADRPDITRLRPAELQDDFRCSIVTRWDDRAVMFVVKRCAAEIDQADVGVLHPSNFTILRKYFHMSQPLKRAFTISPFSNWTPLSNPSWRRECSRALDRYASTYSRARTSLSSTVGKKCVGHAPSDKARNCFLSAEMKIVVSVQWTETWKLCNEPRSRKHSGPTFRMRCTYVRDSQTNL